jgi:hypothetical protein
LQQKAIGLLFGVAAVVACLINRRFSVRFKRSKLGENLRYDNVFYIDFEKRHRNQSFQSLARRRFASAMRARPSAVFGPVEQPP